MQSTKVEQEQAEQEESLGKLRQEMQDLSSLLKSRGWGVLVKYLQGQSAVRERNVVHTPCKNMEAVFEQEYEKGEISGMYQALNLPLSIVETHKEEIKKQEARLPLEDKEDT